MSALSLACSASAGYEILSIQCPGGGSPQQFCSYSGGLTHICTAAFSGTELNVRIVGNASSTAVTQFEGVVQGSVYWTVQYTGSSAPPDDAPVTLEFSTSLNLSAVNGYTGQTATEMGDEVFGLEQAAGGQPIILNGSLSEVFTTVPDWVEVSPGVWQGNTGYYSPNLSIVCETAATPPNPNNFSGGVYGHNVKVVDINGDPVTGG